MAEVRLVPFSSSIDLTITAEAVRAGDRLRLQYAVTGDLEAVSWPELAAPDRTDELWRTTCFEAFVGVEGGGYLELNLAPSRWWAAYSFASYREGMADLDLAPPAVSVIRTPPAVRITAEVDLSTAFSPSCAPWRVGLSAVIEDVAGERSYWAARHAPGKPDFHHPDSFCLDLPPERS